MGFWEALLQFRFMQHALVAGVLVGAVCSTLSVYVVLRRMAFIGQGISHAAFGGVALSLYLFQSDGFQSDLATNVTTAAFVFAIAMLIAVVSKRRLVSADSAIGIFFAASMALGIILIAMREKYTADVITYLFGSILAVTPADLVSIAVLAALVLLGVALFYKELLYYTFDERMAAATGIPTGFIHYLLLAMLAFSIVVSIKVVGLVLVSAFLVIPGATARLLAGSFGSMMALSVATGVSSVVAGLIASHYAGLPSGATIVLTQFLVFCAASLLRLGGE
ncbi:MAG: metal ABC transporter permease [Armatimonadetes bacterium]|nr:metal ABC transporter permease [Armatimonadota bacterium]